MVINYYPWNVSKLAYWLRGERARYENTLELSEQLGIPVEKIYRWMRERSLAIALVDIQSLAKYRKSSIQELLAWLEIKPAHWELLLEESETQR
jgi:hypothetical protein